MENRWGNNGNSETLVLGAPKSLPQGFPGGLDGKASVYSAGDPGSIPGSGRSPEKGNRTHSSILAWRISWTEEPGELQFHGAARIGHD